MRIIPQRSFLLAYSLASTKVLVSVVLILVVVLASVLAVAYYFLVIAVPTRRIFEQAPTPTVTSTPPWSPVTPTPSIVPPTSTPNLPSTPTPTPTLPTQTPYPKYSLADAISAGYVEASITGRTGLGLYSGASSGDSIILNIKRLVNYTIEIEPIPKGTLLVSFSSDKQNMAVLDLKGLSVGTMYRGRDRIILDTQDLTAYLFSGYCVNFNKDNPNESTMFTMNGLADANVLKIFNVLSQFPQETADIASIQSAVFAVTDNVSRSELQSRFSADSTDIQNAKTILERAGIDTANLRLFQ